ncbi:diguanylate cyclase [Thiomicrorhabdus heinhorstiae]|uniref:diguanylate cyclase n=1 Tax=Thiomicrorhabdus heinhorstiae TaxID=2748010 RepID=A0ABS0C0L0_9GAMM|nr:diguanylate cyclase [Thiomicrorhabdus heinhorstiae]MBF6057781.1 diguanylate cyclase [Thiomicrorhabdus heinhorstiae]
MSKSLVLVVDDEPINLRMVSTILQDRYEILVAKNGHSALEIVEHQKPDLILLDIVMPDMDGFEVIRALRKKTVSAEIPVIFLTSKTDQAAIVESFRLGGVDYITKPFYQEELNVRVDNQVRMHRLQSNLNVELKRSHRNFQIMDRHIAFIFIDFTASITFASSFFCQNFGCSVKDVVGKKVNVLKSNLTPQNLYKELWNTISQEKDYHCEIEDRNFQGGTNWYSVNITPNYDEYDNWIGYIAFYKNIDDQIQLKALSETDKLTGINNRAKLDKELSRELDRSERYDSPLSIIMLDLDYFKDVNDHFGHEIGDQVIQAIAHILYNNVRKVDIVGRWGGEEFLIICPQTDQEGAQTLAENLRSKIEVFDFPEVGQRTSSFGVAQFQKEEDRVTFFRRADQALYKAKREGRNRVCIAMPE